MAEAFSSFDALVATPEPDAAPDTTPEPDVTPEPETKPQPETKPEPQPKPPETTPTTPNQPTGKEKASSLRETLARARTEANEWKTKYETIAAEAKKPKTDAEKEQLLKDREAWNKTRTELENELRFAKYESTQEYKDKYQKPFLTAYEQGQKLLAALNYKEADTTDGFGETVPGPSRKGSEADWDKLMSMTDEDSANKFIADHFGHNAARITVMRDKVLDLNSQRINAIEDFRKQGGERETQIRELTAKQQKEISERWHAANNHAVEKYPQIFGPDPTDTKSNELLQQGMRLADLAFGVLDPADISKLPASIQAKFVNGKLPPAEQANLHSAIRNRAGAYDRLLYTLNKERAEKKTLQEKLDGYEESEPRRGEARKVDPVTGKKTGVAQTLADVDAAFDAIAAGNG